MISLNECGNWIRINRSLIESIDGKKWRTNAMGLVQCSTSFDQKYKDMRLPRIIRIQGRSAKEYRLCKVNSKVYFPKVDYKNKSVHYEIQKCDECKIGEIVYNDKEEKQCSNCGLIYEEVKLQAEEIYNYNDYDNNNKKHRYSYSKVNREILSKEAKKNNDRMKRIVEWEKGIKD